MSVKEQLDGFLKQLTSEKPKVIQELTDDIGVLFQNELGFEQTLKVLESDSNINDKKFRKQMVISLKRQCKIQTRLLYLMSILISSPEFDTIVRQLRMKLDPAKSQEILQDMFKEKLKGKG